MPVPNGYSRGQIALHWIAALLVARQYLFKDGIEAAWSAFQKGAATGFDPLVLAHVAGGGLVLVLALWRLSIRARRGAPGVAGGSRGQRMLAQATHAGLYGLMLLLPLSGAVAWFGGVAAAADAHGVLKTLLLALVALHVLGALYHHFVLKDGVLNRMRRAEG
jgi:cytochrome b561